MSLSYVTYDPVYMGDVPVSLLVKSPIFRILYVTIDSLLNKKVSSEILKFGQVMDAYGQIRVIFTASAQLRAPRLEP